MKKNILPLLGLFLSACAASSPTATEEVAPVSDSTDESGTDVEIATLEVARYEPIEFELVQAEPIEIELPSIQTFDGIGSLYFDQGMYYSLIGGTEQSTDLYYVYQAVSHDGLEWVFNESDLAANVLFEGGGCVPRELLRTRDQQWIYYAQCSHGNSLEDATYIIHLTAYEFTGPWTWHPAPIVGGNDVEDTPVWYLKTITTETGYRMYFYYPLNERIGVAESEDGFAWHVLGEDGSTAPSEEIFSLLDHSGNELYPRRIEAVWQEGDGWYMVYLELRSPESSLESYTPAYALAVSDDGLHWISIADVVLPETETGEMMIITSMLSAQDSLIATLCQWSPEGGMTCYLGRAQEPAMLEE